MRCASTRALPFTALLAQLLACASQVSAPATLSEALAQVPALLVETDTPGAAVALVEAGEVRQVLGFGLLSADPEIRLVGGELFQAASLSKPVAAWGVLQLVEQGRLSLDSPVDRSLKRWRLPPSQLDRDGVTIRRLLSHTAGLSLHGYPGFPPDLPLPGLEASLSGETNGAGGVELEHAPGEAHRYSGGGYTLLQLLIEEAAGKTFAEYMATEVLAPLSMTASSFDPDDAGSGHSARPHDRQGREIPLRRFRAQAAAGLHTSAGDLGLFIAAHSPGPTGEPVGRGVLRPETVASMWRPAPGTDGTYGLGFALASFTGARHLVWHTGANHGYRSLLAILPEQQRGLVVLTNGDAGGAVCWALLCAWTREHVGEAAPGCNEEPPGAASLPTAAFLVPALLLLLLLVVNLRRRRRRC